MFWVSFLRTRYKGGGGCEYGSEPSGSIRGGEFLEKLAEKYQLLDKTVMESECMLNQSSLLRSL